MPKEQAKKVFPIVELPDGSSLLTDGDNLILEGVATVALFAGFVPAGNGRRSRRYTDPEPVPFRTRISLAGLQRLVADAARNAGGSSSTGPIRVQVDRP